MLNLKQSSDEVEATKVYSNDLRLLAQRFAQERRCLCDLLLKDIVLLVMKP